MAVANDRRSIRNGYEGGTTMPDGMTVDYDGLIPNNVGLNDDARVRKALETWHPGYIDWWKDKGPDGFQDALVYLRTAIGVDTEGWAKFGFVKMLEYKWGILLAPRVEGRRIPFGAHKGELAWQEVPGEHRAMLRRLLVIQGDTEPASVEQQRHLGATAPSLYDLRNLFQVNVEEGRHLWAMVYLLQKYFGRDGREEAEELLRRRSGDRDTPRLLGAFNEATPDWLSFFMFTTFTDRDGKMQLGALAQSGFDPLSRTCRFMLTEEAHHMFVGETGVTRVIERTCQAMRDADIDDPTDVEALRRLGVIDLPLLQRKINLHMSVTLDLFGSEISTNAANAFDASLKGRFREDKLTDDHQLLSDTYPVLRLVDGAITNQDVPALSALNMRLRDDFVGDTIGGIRRWNQAIEKAGFNYRLSLPHVAFNRRIGEFAAAKADPAGTLLSEAQWQARQHEFLPTIDDGVYIASLMCPERRPGHYASWIGPPRVGIDNKPGDFEYVRID
jgi:benzoyl-CoA 2,3-dioxygenase component B